MNGDTMKWKDSLGGFLSSMGVYRLDYVRGNLYKSCAEWIGYLREFNHVHPEISYKNPEDPGTDDLQETRWISLSVALYGLIPFKAYLAITPDADSGMLCLRIHWTESVTFTGPDGRMVFRGEGIYCWKQEKMTEPEIFETEYLLEILNRRLGIYSGR